MKRNTYRILIVISVITFLFPSCEKESPAPAPPTKTVADEINTFIWNDLHDYYLWEKNVPNLTNSYYQSNSDSLTNFLNKNTDHEKFFYDLLYDYGKTDKWSWIVNDYEELEKEFEGITKSMGYNFMLGRYGNEGKVLGYVRYVVKGSPADLAGLKRGDIFIQVNGQQLTTTNYMDLLVNSQAYNLSLADINNSTLVLNGKTPSMTAVEVTEDPIYLDTVYTINNQKIGYLVYNAFVSNYDKELNNVMLKFKNAGISKLILDLRYNGGGSVETATYLASMIYGTNSSKLFLKTEYNENLQNYILQKYGSDYLNINFEANIVNADNSKTPINTLNLSDLYIITTDNTASASECIINGLKPYMNVVTIGTNTHGKYVGSMTLKDYIDEKGTVNPKHKWALQPIVLKISNSAGVSDFVNGFEPKVQIDEDISNLSTLGDLNEPLLNATITSITGVSAKSGKMPSSLEVKRLSNDFIHKTDMYYNNPKLSFQGFGK